MKKLLFTASLFMSAAAMAVSLKPIATSEFVVTSAIYAPNHVTNAGAGKLTVDYANKKMRLVVEREMTCPENMKCAAVMPAPLVIELPITSVQTDSCGIHHVTAKRDMRPADGNLQQLTVDDSAAMTCKTLVAVIPEAQYMTSYYDRRGGKEVKDISKMTLALVLPDSSLSNLLLKYEQSAGFSPRPSTHTITVDKLGNVISTIHLLQGDKISTMEIAKLSAAALKNLKAQLAQVPLDVQLVDQDPNAPKCMDAPSTTVSVMSGTTEISIYNWSSCHTYKTDEGNAQNLTQLMLGFATLTH